MQTIPLVIGLIGTVAVLGFWHRRTMLDAPPTLVVQYEPPNGLTPGEVGVIVDSHVGYKDIFATIVDLAVKGYLLIKESPTADPDKPEYELERLKGPADLEPLKLHEKEVMQKLFGKDLVTSSFPLGVLSYQKNLLDALPDIRWSLYKQATVSGLYAKRPDISAGYLRAAGIGLIILAAFIWFVVASLEPKDIGPLDLVPFVPGALLAFIAPRLVGRSEAGRQAYAHALGFQEYLSRAEKYRIEWQEKQRIFEAYLPFAMTFGVADKWASVFAGAVAQPSWYGGDLGSRPFRPERFLAAVDRSIASAQAARSREARRSRSGFGSRGRSGGGRGGGGGGSW